MTETTDDPEVYRDRWSQHVDDLRMVANTLPEGRRAEFLELVDEVEDFVDEAADELGRAD